MRDSLNITDNNGCLYFHYYVGKKHAFKCRINYDKNIYEITEVITDYDFRRQGICTKILKIAIYLSYLIVNKENKDVFLRVLKNNTNAISVYKKLGFLKTYKYDEKNGHTI